MIPNSIYAPIITIVKKYVTTFAHVVWASDGLGAVVWGLGTVLYGAQISINDKKNFQRSFSALGTDNFMAKYEQSDDEEEEHQFPGNNFLIITSDQLLNIKC